MSDLTDKDDAEIDRIADGIIRRGHYTPGPKATPEGVKAEIVKALRGIRDGDYEEIDQLDDF